MNSQIETHMFLGMGPLSYPFFHGFALGLFISSIVQLFLSLYYIYLRTEQLHYFPYIIIITGNIVLMNNSLIVHPLRMTRNIAFSDFHLDSSITAVVDCHVHLLNLSFELFINFLFYHFSLWTLYKSTFIYPVITSSLLPLTTSFIIFFLF